VSDLAQTLEAAPMIPPGRDCGTCTLCCKLFPVPDLAKPAGRWCQHIVQGRGCGIHATRPTVCRSFFCQWVYNEALGPEWKPEVCKFVLSIYGGTNSLVVTADPGFPRNWAREPYIGDLRRWAAAAMADGHQVIVFNGDHVTAILADGEKLLGTVGLGDRLVTVRRGLIYDVEWRRHADA
jgi:hypothetical protein